MTILGGRQVAAFRPAFAKFRRDAAEKRRAQALTTTGKTPRKIFKLPHMDLKPEAPGPKHAPFAFELVDRESDYSLVLACESGAMQRGSRVETSRRAWRGDSLLVIRSRTWPVLDKRRSVLRRSTQ